MVCYDRYLKNCRTKGIAPGGRCCVCDDSSGKLCGDTTSEEREERCNRLDDDNKERSLREERLRAELVEERRRHES